MITKNEELILKAIEVEQQAIAIYEMECLIFRLTSWSHKRRYILFILQTILAEEKSHKHKLVLKMNGQNPAAWRIKWARFSGFFLGFFLTFLPRPWFWQFHSMAEVQAARIYETTLFKMDAPDEQMRNLLEELSKGEERHAKIFNEHYLLKI